MMDVCLSQKYKMETRRSMKYDKELYIIIGFYGGDEDVRDYQE